jgi:trehalose 6-phosphate synthase/phosphatase
MQESELADRTRRNLEFSTRLTTEKWAQHVLLDLKSVERSDEPMENFSLGFGMGYRVMGVKTGFDVVDVVSLSRAYRSSHSRLIVLDWGGTLVAESEKSDKVLAYAVAKGHAQRSGPTPELKETLEKLCADPKNIVFVVSGKEVHPVAEFFGDVKGLGLGAEHGFYYRWPRENAHSSNISTQVRDNMENWRTIMSLGNQEWKESAKYVMDIYVQRTHGTYIEVKGSALIWQFRDADPEFGLMQSHELEENLKAVLVEHGVEVIRGGGVADGYIEVRPAGVSKGLFVQHITAMLKAHHREVDFVLAIGDDSSDEPMFREVNRMKEVGQILNPSNSFTVTVGKKPSAAQSYVADTVAVMDLLVTLNRLSQRESSGSSSSKKYHSVEDLTSFATTDATKRATFSQLYKVIRCMCLTNASLSL